jgi:hypothetical protein
MPMPTKALLRRKISNPLLVVPALLALSIALPTRAEVPPACRPVIDAIMKQIGTPTHMYMTETAAFRGGKPTTAESIYAGGAIYIQIHGMWRRSPMTTAEMTKQQEENQKNLKAASCRYLRDETMNGEPAVVYVEHSESEGATSDATTWVSKSRGLPLRLDSDIDAGGKMGKTHRSIRYEYSNVQAPAGVK